MFDERYLLLTQIRPFAFSSLLALSYLLGANDTPQASGQTTQPNSKQTAPTLPVDEWLRIPAEFEKQQALVVSICDWQPHHRQVLTQLADKTQGHIDLLILHNTAEQLKDLKNWLKEAGSPTNHISVLQVQLDTIWLRDFAPILAECQTGAVALDFYYYGGARPNDERLPSRWAAKSSSLLREISWTVQGGNLISNGQYCALTSTKIFEENKISFPGGLRGQNPVAEGRKILTKDLVKQLNLAKMVLLEPLRSEATQHVDMFATFVTPTDIVVGQVDRRSDPTNAAILDRNAKTLQQLTVGEKKVTVHRLPFPPRKGDSWSSYTNIIFANDLLLIPVFDDDPPNFVGYAKDFYAKLLPGWEIATIDISSMRKLQGALHCLSSHVPAFAKLPSDAQPLNSR